MAEPCEDGARTRSQDQDGSRATPQCGTRTQEPARPGQGGNEDGTTAGERGWPTRWALGLGAGAGLDKLCACAVRVRRLPSGNFGVAPPAFPLG